MKQLKSAIWNALAGNQRLVKMIGSTDAITQSWPEQDAAYTVSTPGDAYENLPSVTPPRAAVTFRIITPSKDRDLPKRDDTFQVDVWSPNPDLVDVIVSELEETLDQDDGRLSGRFIALVVDGAVVKETYFSRGVDQYESDTRLYHTTNNLRVLWDP